MKYEFGEVNNIPEIALQWKKLLAKSKNNLIFYTPEWAEVWLNTFGGNLEVRIFTLFQNKKLVAVAPFVVKKLNRFITRAEFISGDAADYHDLIIDKKEDNQKTRNFFLSKIISAMPRVDVIRFENFSQENEDSIKKLLIKAHKKYKTKKENAPFIKLPKNIEEFNKSISRTLLEGINKKERRLSKLGDLSFEAVLDKEKIISLLPSFFELHQTAWHKREQKSIYDDEITKKYHTNLVDKLSNLSWINFFIVSLNHKPVSIHFGFEYNKRLYNYITTYDPEFNYYSPGRIQLYELIKYSTAKNLELFDFLRGEETYKSEWTDQSQQIVSFDIYNSTIGAFLLRMKSKFS